MTISIEELGQIVVKTMKTQAFGGVFSQEELVNENEVALAVATRVLEDAAKMSEGPVEFVAGHDKHFGGSSCRFCTAERLRSLLTSLTQKGS